MQDSLKKVAPRWAWTVVKAVLLLLIVGTVWYTLRQQKQDIDDILGEFQLALLGENTPVLALILALTGLNWSLEARKWQALASKIEVLTFAEALRGVLAGLAIGFVSQVNAGEFAGKVGSLKSAHRLDALGAVLLGSIVQSFVTLTFGTLAFVLFLLRTTPERGPIQGVFVAVLLSLIFVCAGMYTQRHQIEHWFSRYSWLRPLGRHLSVLQSYSSLDTSRVLGWAVLRHGTFMLQFMLVLGLFRIELPWLDAASAVNLVFLAKTLIPAFHFLSDLGIREFSALYFFGAFGLPAARVVSATLTLWLVNVLIPVLVGSLFVLQLKWGRR